MKKMFLLAALSCGVAFSTLAASGHQPKAKTVAKAAKATSAAKVLIDHCGCYPVSACESSQVLCWCNATQRDAVINLFIKQACGV